MFLRFNIILFLTFYSFPTFAFNGDSQLFSNFLTFLNPNIEVKIDEVSIPSKESILINLQQNMSIPNVEILDSIKNIQDFNNIAKPSNIIELANGLTQGNVITNQKLFGIFDIQIPYQVTFDSVKGQITEKLTDGFWNYILDLLSY